MLEKIKENPLDYKGYLEYGITLACLSDKKFSKVLNLIMAAIWAIAAVLNVVGF